LGPDVLKPRTIFLAVDFNASGVMIECRPKAKMTDGIWQRTASNPSNIQFSDGNVGVGTTEPQFLLDLETGQNSTSWLGVKSSPVVAGHGGLLLHQDSTFGFQMHTEGTASAAGSYMSMSLVRTSDGAMQTPSIIRLNGTGNVGIGTANPLHKLEVNGGVKINPVSTAKPFCDSNSRGTIWVEKGASGVADTTQVCRKRADDAYEWASLAGGGGAPTCNRLVSTSGWLTNSTNYSISCPSGTMTGGGCTCADAGIERSYASSSTTWTCACDGGSNITATIICCQ
jgi:hypothetical protein